MFSNPYKGKLHLTAHYIYSYMALSHKSCTFSVVTITPIVLHRYGCLPIIPGEFADIILTSKHYFS